MQAQLAVERPSDTVRPVWRARDEGAGGLISPSGSGGLMPGTASPAPQLRLKLVALADFSQHTMPGVGRLIKTFADEAGVVERMRTQEFGCDLCWPADARAAWGARDGLSRMKELIDESHFIVTILACPRCAQRYVSISLR